MFLILEGVINAQRSRRIGRLDPPAALYKDTGKKVLLPLYLDGLYWTSCLRFSIPSSSAAAAVRNLSPKQNVGGWPLSQSEGRVSLIMIWVIITQQRKRKRDEEGGRQRNVGWWCPLSVSQSSSMKKILVKEWLFFSTLRRSLENESPSVPYLLYGETKVSDMVAYV